jgi:DNA-binding HxlR family transcriptional regulator
MVVCALATGPKRYGELRRHIGGITHKMLAQTLRRMEADGLVSRTILPGKLPGVEYRLTPFSGGKSSLSMARISKSAGRTETARGSSPVRRQALPTPAGTPP